MVRFLRHWVAAIAASVMLVLVGCSGSGTSTPSSPAASPTTAGAGEIAVTLKEWAVTPSTTTASGGSVTFNVTNGGTVPHEFVALRTDTPAGDFPIGTFEGEPQRIDEDTAGENVGETGDMNVGGTKTLTIDLPPGHYALVCNLPGHYGQGMHTDFTVS